MSGFVIKPHRPWWRRLLYVLFLGILLLLTAILLSDNSHWSDIQQRIISVLGNKAQVLAGEKAQLREKVLMLEQTTRLDKQAAALLQEGLITSQQQIYRLKKDLEFYQGIMNTAGGDRGQDIHGIRIQPLTRERGYRLELILIHVAKTDKMIEGVITVALEGIQDGVRRRLDLSEISLDRNMVYDFKFRSFQRFENDFILPENFKPQRVFVTLSPDDGEDTGFEKVFDWPETDGRETIDVG